MHEENAFQRAFRDTKETFHGCLWPWLAEVLAVGLAGYLAIGYGPLAPVISGVVTALCIFVFIFMAYLVRAPVVQRNEARRLLQAKSALLDIDLRIDKIGLLQIDKGSLKEKIIVFTGRCIVVNRESEPVSLSIMNIDLEVWKVVENIYTAIEGLSRSVLVHRPNLEKFDHFISNSENWAELRSLDYLNMPFDMDPKTTRVGFLAFYIEKEDLPLFQSTEQDLHLYRSGFIREDDQLKRWVSLSIHDYVSKRYRRVSIAHHFPTATNS